MPFVGILLKQAVNFLRTYFHSTKYVSTRYLFLIYILFAYVVISLFNSYNFYELNSAEYTESVCDNFSKIFDPSLYDLYYSMMRNDPYNNIVWQPGIDNLNRWHSIPELHIYRKIYAQYIPDESKYMIDADTFPFFVNTYMHRRMCNYINFIGYVCHEF